MDKYITWPFDIVFLKQMIYLVQKSQSNNMRCNCMTMFVDLAIKCNGQNNLKCGSYLIKL